MTELLSTLADNINLVSALTALIAICLSFISIALAAFTTHQNHQHQIKSVRPVPVFVQGKYRDRLYIMLENAGVGPLFVVDFKVTDTVKDKTYQSIIDAMPKLPSGMSWDRYHADMEGRVIPADKHIELLSLKAISGHRGFEAARDNVMASLQNLDLSLTYSDLYGKPNRPHNQKLDWFGAPFPESKKN